MLIPLALLAASCGGNSDSTTSEDSVLEDSASEDRRDSLDDSGDTQSDSQNSQGFWRENDNPQSEDPNRAIAITAGNEHTCALRQTGTITCWGNNGYGRLGNGTQTDSSVPVEVLGINDATQITASYDYTCALRQTGTITCWGGNRWGQLGNGQGSFGEYSSVPVEVIGITDATQITASSGHTCALRQTGTITCWGAISFSQLFNGTTSSSNVPVEVIGITDATQITASATHTCALRQTGTITCWGNNGWGQLGNGQRGSGEYSSVPVEVLGINDATQITAREIHTCALRQTGTITCWGANNRGQLGNGQSGDDPYDNSADSSVPVEVLGINDATQITADGDGELEVGGHTCALRQTGTITCWGNNYYGQLGNGQSGPGEYSSVPVEVLGINDATTITAGYDHSCALRQTGTITCWGANNSGQLGNGTTSSSNVPVEVLGINDATQITAGSGHSCALRQTGTITCWGANNSGQLGNGTTSSSNVPVEVLGINDATQITAREIHTCALRQTGTITCWGNNYYGQLGNGQSGPGEYSSVPVEVLGINDATQITAGDEHTCALRQTGTITCWGHNWAGQLGNGQSGDYGYDNSADSSVPVEVLGINDATQITAGDEHTCALRQTGTITCWGNNYYGQLGNGQSGYGKDSSVPVEVTGITDATQITAGNEHTCALRQTGTITCWGNNEYGQLGNGQSGYGKDSSVPVEVTGITDATQITAGDGHTCALRQTGTITCWGNNRYGQLGNGQRGYDADSSVPVEVLGINDATQITAGWLHTCALRQTGTITCWGHNEYGWLGNGVFLPQNVVGFGG